MDSCPPKKTRILDEYSSEDDGLFDHLPDEIVLSIFNNLQDAKTLRISMCVCKRFRSIAPDTDEVSLTISRKSKASNSVYKESGQETFYYVNRPLIMKLDSKEEDYWDVPSFYVRDEFLKPFVRIRSLHLKLGSGNDIEKKNSKPFIKWKAEFGRGLHSCVMLVANSLTDRKPEDYEERTSSIFAKRGSMDRRGISGDELDLRSMWGISIMSAASARHFLIQETLERHQTIENLVVSDERNQGRLCMNEEQIQELIQGTRLTEFMRSFDNLRVGGLRMKMWYLEKLELLDSGKVMEGATLMVIRPGGDQEVVMGQRNDQDLVAEAFVGDGEDHVIEEAVRKLMVAKGSSMLESNRFPLGLI